MINFHRTVLEDKPLYEEHLAAMPERGCEYSFANLFMWGRQELAFEDGCVLFFSHFNGRSVYPFPIGGGDRRAALEKIISDARQRGIPCRITNMTESDRQDLETWFPGLFEIRHSRDNYDYVYAVDALADLRGKKLQKKRNHVNRFRSQYPDYRVEPISCANLPRVQHMINDWFLGRRQSDPEGDYLLENLAMAKAFSHYEGLQMEGIALLLEDRVVAVTLGSRISSDTFDIHFEKAREEIPGAYNAVNCEFARYLRMKYPEAVWLNREDDMGLEGLRSAKLSYGPHHMIEKYWACLREEIYED